MTIKKQDKIIDTIIDFKEKLEKKYKVWIVLNIDDILENGAARGHRRPVQRSKRKKR